MIHVQCIMFIQVCLEDRNTDVEGEIHSSEYALQGVTYMVK